MGYIYVVLFGPKFYPLKLSFLNKINISKDVGCGKTPKKEW